MEQPPSSSAKMTKASLSGLPPPRPSPASGRGRSFLEVNSECTGVLLDSLGVIGVEDDVVADVGAHGDALLERRHKSPAHVDHRIVAGLNRVLIRLPPSERAARGSADERRDR